MLVKGAPGWGHHGRPVVSLDVFDQYLYICNRKINSLVSEDIILMLGCNVIQYNLLSHPGILGVTLCFCTGSYAAASGGAGRRFCSCDNFWTTFWLSFNFWHDCWPWPINYLITFWLIFVVTLTLNFQGQIWTLLYLIQKWSDCHETESKHIDWTPGLKCDQLVWPWPWLWPLNFEGHM